MTVEVISPHGFCAGVKRALRMANAALAEGNVPLYGLHEIVHNESVVADLTAKGMRFVDAVDDVPSGATLLVSAHGTSPATFADAEKRSLKVIDATCPFVAAGHAKIRENFSRGMRTVIIGMPGHAEVQGYLGEPGACLPSDVKPGEETGRVVQTTLDSGEHAGVCSATRDRQQAVRSFVESNRGRGLISVGVLVVGSPKSANTARLADIAEQCGARAWRIASPEDVTGLDLKGVDVIGLTSGASTPEPLFLAVFAALQARAESRPAGDPGQVRKAGR